MLLFLAALCHAVGLSLAVAAPPLGLLPGKLPLVVHSVPVPSVGFSVAAPPFGLSPGELPLVVHKFLLAPSPDWLGCPAMRRNMAAKAANSLVARRPGLALCLKVASPPRPPPRSARSFI